MRRLKHREGLFIACLCHDAKIEQAAERTSLIGKGVVNAGPLFADQKNIL